MSARNGWLIWAALVVLVAIAAAPILTYPLGRDQGEFAIIGTTILRGGVPYVDVWNPKPPAVFYLYASAIHTFGPHEWSIRTLDFIAWPLMALALYDIGRRMGGRALGLWAVLLYGVTVFGEDFWTLSQNDGLAALPMAWAVWAVAALFDTPDEARRSRVVLALGAGMASALALWFKYPYVMFIVALVIATVWARGLRPLEIAAYSAGGLLVGLGGMTLLASAGAFGAWIESIRVTTGYTAQGYSLAALAQGFGAAWPERWARWGIVWGLAGGALMLSVFTRSITNHNRFSFFPNRPMTNDPIWRMIMVWLLGTAVALFIQAKGYNYHWLPMLPPLTLLAAYMVTAITSLPERPLWRGVFVSAIGVILLALLTARTWGTAWPYLRGTVDRTTYAAGFIGGEFVAADSIAAANALAAHVPRESTMFVWGFRPELYYLTGTRPATRFIFQFPLVADWYPSAWREEAVETLWAALPSAVVVVRGDYMAWVTGINADSNTLLQQFEPLNNWLMFNYTPADEVGPFIIWLRNEE